MKWVLAAAIGLAAVWAVDSLLRNFMAPACAPSDNAALDEWHGC